MKLLIVTSHFPYGTWNEAFFETEFEILSSSFQEVNILPLKRGPLHRTLPQNVVVWEPVANRGKWSHAKQFCNPSTWATFFSLLLDCRRARKRISWKNIKNILAAASWRVALLNNKRLIKFLDSDPTVIVYAYWGHFPAIVIPIAKARGSKTCVRYHSIDLYVERELNDGFIPFSSMIRSCSDMSVFISKHGFDYYDNQINQINKNNTDNTDKRVINRLGSPDFGPPISSNSGRSTNITMVSVSSISQVKQVHLIARLAKELAKYVCVEWHHFGSGYSAELNDELAGVLPEALTVKMWGITPRSRIQEFYRKSDVTFFVNLSTFEGVPVSIMEALNAGIPIVASNVGGVGEVVIDGKSGMLVSSEKCFQTSILAAEILSELQKGGRIYRSVPRSVWEDSYDADKNAKDMVEHLKSLVNHCT